MKYLSCKKIFSNTIVAKIFVFVLIMFLVTGFVSEWRVSSSLQQNKLENKANYEAILQNGILLNRCYVQKPDENYCFAVLKIISTQLNNATFQTSNMKFIWTNCYLYLASVALQDYPKLHDRWVTIALNEEAIKGNKSDYEPATPNKIIKLQQELRAEYRARIQLEISQKEEKLKNSSENDVKPGSIKTTD